MATSPNTVLATTDLSKMSKADLDKQVAELTGGVQFEKINLKVNRGKYFAVIADVNGVLLYEVDPDDGSKRLAKLDGDSGWQFVDALHNRLTKIPGAAKFMAWKWNSDQNEYQIARTKYGVNGAQVGEEGVIDHYIRRKAGKSTVVKTSIVPGVTELQWLASKALSLAAPFKGKIKVVDGKVLNSDGVQVSMDKDAKTYVLNGAIAFFKAIGISPAEGRKLLSESWPELWDQPQKPATPAAAGTENKK